MWRQGESELDTFSSQAGSLSDASLVEAESTLTDDEARGLPDGSVPVAIFNVKYSPNLGDGVIAECLEHALAKAEPSLCPRSIDLAGRQAYDAANGSGRRQLIGVIEALPGFLRRRLVPTALKALVGWKLSPRWREQMPAQGAVILGGGNLLADHDQNFPIKIAAALDLAHERQVPVAIASVGVGSDWSRAGNARLTKAVGRTRLISATVRDQISRDNWEAHLSSIALPDSTGHAPEIALDPGLLASRVYGLPLANSSAKRIGICVTAPEVLRLHGKAGSDASDLDWMTGFVTTLLDNGQQLTLFTNGSPEDQHFLDALTAFLPAHPGLQTADRFTKPSELAAFIGSLDGVIAHRLHACIVAHSYAVPCVGLAWDRKLVGFFDTVDRSSHIIDPSLMSPEEAARCALAGLADRPSAGDVARLQDECFASIARLARLIRQEASVG